MTCVCVWVHVLRQESEEEWHVSMHVCMQLGLNIGYFDMFNFQIIPLKRSLSALRRQQFERVIDPRASYHHSQSLIGAQCRTIPPPLDLQ